MEPASDSSAPAPLPEVAVDLALLENFAWQRLFAVTQPIELEIGAGKAGFLLQRARQHPERNFLGIEWAGEFYRFAVDRMQRWGMPNVRLLRSDGGHFLRFVCPPASLTVLHVYHPDPWPKKRHHKRRLVQSTFVQAAARCLVPGGLWRVQTDHAEYFEIIRALLTTEPAFAEAPFDDPALGAAADAVDTNFEVKYRREGRPIYRVAVRRV